MGSKKALVTGVTGQDGSYLAELLLPRARSGDSERSVRDFYHRSRLKLKAQEGESITRTDRNSRAPSVR